MTSEQIQVLLMVLQRARVTLAEQLVIGLVVDEMMALVVPAQGIGDSGQGIEVREQGIGTEKKRRRCRPSWATRGRRWSSG
jgi:hypothetical protein